MRLEPAYTPDGAFAASHGPVVRFEPLDAHDARHWLSPRLPGFVSPH
jgi:hypothetical protein